MRAKMALWYVLAAITVSQAAPPVVPVELKAEVGKPVQLTVTGSAGKKVGTAKTFDPTALVFVRLWSEDPNTYEYLVWASAEGTSYVPFWTEGETTAAVCKITVGKGAVKPPPADPVDPPPATGKKFFLLVRADGPIDPVGFEPYANLPAWKELAALGHLMADVPISKLSPTFPKPAGLPAMIVTTVNADGKSITYQSTAAIPKTDTEIRGLVK